MIRVTIEVIPFGDESLAKTVGTVLIANVSPRGTDPADYVVEKSDAHGFMQEHGVVRGHRRTAGIWPLLASAFQPLEVLPPGLGIYLKDLLRWKVRHNS